MSRAKYRVSGRLPGAGANDILYFSSSGIPLCDELYGAKLYARIDKKGSVSQKMSSVLRRVQRKTFSIYCM